MTMSEGVKKKTRKRSISLGRQHPAAVAEPIVEAPAAETETAEPKQPAPAVKAVKSAPAAPQERAKPSKTKGHSSGATEKISMYFEQRVFDDIEDEFYEFKGQHPDAHPTLNGFTSQAFEAGLEHYERDKAAQAAFVEDLSLPKADPDDEDRKRIQRSVYLTPGLKARIDDEFARWRHEQRAWLRSQRLRPKIGNFIQALLKAGLTHAQTPSFAANLPDDPRRSDG